MQRLKDADSVLICTFCLNVFVAGTIKNQVVWMNRGDRSTPSARTEQEEQMPRQGEHSLDITLNYAPSFQGVLISTMTANHSRPVSSEESLLQTKVYLWLRLGTADLLFDTIQGLMAPA